MQNKKFGALSSSANPQELSETVSSILKMIGYFLGTLATLKGVDANISDEQIEQLTNAIVLIISSGFAIYQSGTLVMGFVRRLIAKFLGE